MGRKAKLAKEVGQRFAHRLIVVNYRYQWAFYYTPFLAQFHDTRMRLAWEGVH